MLAVDFMPNLIAENERVNGHLPNARFAVGDATELQLPAGSVDVLFSNWLLMYLGDEEVAGLASRALSWVVPGGVVFFRESCFRQSGDKKRAKNPTHYRDPREYFRLFDDARGVAADGVTKVKFELVTCRCVDTYVRLKQNQNQLCWKWRVVKVSENEGGGGGGDPAAAAAAAAAAPAASAVEEGDPTMALSSGASSKSSTPAAAPADAVGGLAVGLLLGGCGRRHDAAPLPRRRAVLGALDRALRARVRARVRDERRGGLDEGAAADAVAGASAQQGHQERGRGGFVVAVVVVFSLRPRHRQRARWGRRDPRC